MLKLLTILSKNFSRKIFWFKLQKDFFDVKMLDSTKMEILMKKFLYDSYDIYLQNNIEISFIEKDIDNLFHKKSHHQMLLLFSFLNTYTLNLPESKKS